MKWIFLIMLCIGSKFTFGKNINVQNYHRLVNKAELAITEGQLNDGLSYYDSAFQFKDRPFAQDLYNAGLCAVKLKLSKKAENYLVQLAEKGVGEDFFNRSIAFQSLAGTKTWKQILVKAKVTHEKILRENQILLQTIDSLVAKDQRVNVDWRDAGMADRERQIMDLTYDTIQAQLKSVFDSVGFITEDMIGAQLTEFSTLAYRMPFDVIIIHNYQSRMSGDTLFRPLLLDALQKGLIKPEYLATMEDFGSNNNTRPYYGSSHFYVQYQCSVYLEKSNFQRLADIEKARASIGLCTTQEQLKKVIYTIQNPSSEFRILAGMSKIGSFGNKESEQRMLDNSEVIINQVPDCKN